MLRAVSLELMYLLLIRDGQIHILYIYISIYACFCNTWWYIYISITPAQYCWVYKLAPGVSHITIHCSHATTMPRKGSSSSTWKKFKTKQKKQASLQKRRNQRCIGCLRKSCPKKFNNNNEDKCGEFINFLLFKYYIEYASSKIWVIWSNMSILFFLTSDN